MVRWIYSILFRRMVSQYEICWIQTQFLSRLPIEIYIQMILTCAATWQNPTQHFFFSVKKKKEPMEKRINQVLIDQNQMPSTMTSHIRTWAIRIEDTSMEAGVQHIQGHSLINIQNMHINGLNERKVFQWRSRKYFLIIVHYIISQKVKKKALQVIKFWKPRSSL